jgi:repressor LexA
MTMDKPDYKKILKEAIQATGLTLRRVSFKFDECGTNLDPSYLSRLQTGKLPPASDELNKKIAEVLDINETTLRLAAHLSKIPEDLLPYLEIKE